MDIDDDAHAPGSPTPEDQLILTITNGESVGVQSDKIAELGPQTSILTVPDSTHVEHTAWNPKDPSVLAVGGEALCRLWYISRTAALNDNPRKSYIDLIELAHGSMVTSMAWSPNGEILAVATRDDSSEWIGFVNLWSKAGKALDELSAVQDMVFALRWSPSGSQLLGITSSGAETSSLTLWDIQSTQPMLPYQLPNIIVDAAWTSNNQIIVCGHDIIASSLLEGGKILTLHHRLEPLVQQTWTHIRYDSRTHTTALAAEESGVLGFIDASDTLRTFTAHDAEITALAYQPITNLSAYPASAPRLLATSSNDGTIKIWDAKRPFNSVLTLSLGYAGPAMAMSFTPDGYLIAAANGNRVMIWNAETGGLPKASWKGLLGKLSNGSLTNGNGADAGIMEEEAGESNPSLSWDAEGGKLALGVGRQVGSSFFEVMLRTNSLRNRLQSSISALEHLSTSLLCERATQYIVRARCPSDHPDHHSNTLRTFGYSGVLLNRSTTALESSQDLKHDAYNRRPARPTPSMEGMYVLLPLLKKDQCRVESVSRPETSSTRPATTCSEDDR